MGVVFISNFSLSGVFITFLSFYEKHELDHLDGRLYLDHLASMADLRRVDEDGDLVDV